MILGALSGVNAKVQDASFYSREEDDHQWNK